jgi:hypothetical protein
MMRDRGLSGRALADEIGVSEGTIRNAAAYADAAEVRNGYAFEQLTIRQLRVYLSLPQAVGDVWLDAGARLDDLAQATLVTIDMADGRQQVDMDGRAHQTRLPPVGPARLAAAVVARRVGRVHLAR